LKLLLYADDLVLFAENMADLQAMLDVLNQFCVHYNMTVNAKKSEALVFNRQFCGRTMAPNRLTYDGVALEVKTGFPYLGMYYDDTDSIRHALQHNMEKGRKAMYAMIRRCNELEMHNVRIMCHLFDSLVKPIIDYGCEVWGPMFLTHGLTCDTSKKTDIQGQVEQVQVEFLRHVLGVHKGTPTVCMMHELARVPMSTSWLKQCLRFWNKVVARSGNDLVRMAMVESCDLARDGHQTWAALLDQCLGTVGIGHILLRRDGLHAVPVKLTVSRCLQGWKHTCMAAVPAVLPGVDNAVRSASERDHAGFKLLTYWRWFAPDQDTARRDRWWFHLTDKACIHALAQFRLGSHWLQIERGRYMGTPRNQRICACGHDREDEMHFLVCRHYAAVRRRFPHCLPGLNEGVDTVADMQMKFWMNRSGCSKQAWNDLARFILSCKAWRDTVPKLCVSFIGMLLAWSRVYRNMLLGEHVS
jgi:Reverse transcriptase (RNA-dependent DNA polymerase)